MTFPRLLVWAVASSHLALAECYESLRHVCASQGDANFPQADETLLLQTKSAILHIAERPTPVVFIKSKPPSVHVQSAPSALAFTKPESKSSPPDWTMIIVLSVASSLDNLFLGVAVGSGGHPFPRWTLLIVSLMNAIGMVVSGCVGLAIERWAPAAAALAAAAFFCGIGSLEIRSWWRNSDGSVAKLVDDAIAGNAFLLGVPMTLNNLATGMGSGLANGNLWILGSATFVASAVLCWGGNLVGLYTGKLLPIDPRLAGGLAFVGLAVYTVINWAAR